MVAYYVMCMLHTLSCAYDYTTKYENGHDGDSDNHDKDKENTSGKGKGKGNGNGMMMQHWWHYQKQSALIFIFQLLLCYMDQGLERYAAYSKSWTWLKYSLVQWLLQRVEGSPGAKIRSLLLVVSASLFIPVS